MNLIDQIRKHLGEDAVVQWDIVEPLLAPLDQITNLSLRKWSHDTYEVLADDRAGRSRFITRWTSSIGRWFPRQMTDEKSASTALASFYFEPLDAFRERCDRIASEYIGANADQVIPGGNL